MAPIVAYEISGEEGSPLGVAPGERIYVHWACIPESMRNDEYTVRGVGWKELPGRDRDYKCHECNSYLIDNPELALRDDPDEPLVAEPEPTLEEDTEDEEEPWGDDDDEDDDDNDEPEEVVEDEPEPPDTTWICPRCGGLNTARREECYFGCGYVAHTRAGLARTVRVVRVNPQED